MDGFRANIEVIRSIELDLWYGFGGWVAIQDGEQSDGRWSLVDLQGLSFRILTYFSFLISSSLLLYGGDAFVCLSYQLLFFFSLLFSWVRVHATYLGILVRNYLHAD